MSWSQMNVVSNELVSTVMQQLTRLKLGKCGPFRKIGSKLYRNYDYRLSQFE